MGMGRGGGCLIIDSVVDTGVNGKCYLIILLWIQGGMVSVTLSYSVMDTGRNGKSYLIILCYGYRGKW